MKRSICILFCISAIILSAGCSQEKDISADKTDELSTPIQEFIDDRYGSQTNTVIYPESVEEVDSQHLRYKSRSELHPYSITFPNIFSVENIFQWFLWYIYITFSHKHHLSKRMLICSYSTLGGFHPLLSITEANIKKCYNI